MVKTKHKHIMKGVVIEIDFGEPSSSPLEPPIKSRLELSSKQSKEYSLEGINKKLKHAACKREAMLQLKEEKLQLLAQEREDKMRRKESYEECGKQEMLVRLAADHEKVAKRRVQRQKEMVRKLRARNEKVTKVATEASQRKKQQTDSLKAKIMEKLEDYEEQREKSREERVKKLENYHSKLAKAVQARRAKDEQIANNLVAVIEKKQLQAKENRGKHIQKVKMLAEEVADKVKKIQEFVYESECI